MGGGGGMATKRNEVTNQVLPPMKRVLVIPRRRTGEQSLHLMFSHSAKNLHPSRRVGDLLDENYVVPNFSIPIICHSN